MVLGSRVERGDLREGLTAGAGHEHALAAAGDALHDGQQLLRALAGAEDGLGKAPAQRAMVVHLGEPEVLEGQALEALQGLLGRNTPLPHFVEEVPQGLGTHGTNLDLSKRLSNI